MRSDVVVNEKLLNEVGRIVFFAAYGRGVNKLLEQIDGSIIKFVKIKAGIHEAVMLFNERSQYRNEFLGIIFKSEVGEVYAINSAIVFNPIKVDAIDVVKIVGIFGH